MTKNLTAFFLIILLLVSCAPEVQQSDVSVTVAADGTMQTVSLPSGSSVQQALTSASVNLSQLDRVEPPVYTLVSDGLTITVTRVREEFETQQVVIPFERQELHNESLPAGEIHLIQAGQNGLREITIRNVYENDIETASSQVSNNILQAAVPEIVMIGVQSPFAPLLIPGKLAYLKGGNAWLMEGSTSNPRPLVTTGDLDGNVFALSPDGSWLLFSRKSELSLDEQINTLWVINTKAQSATPIDLGISNIINFAAWQPGEFYLIAYSTVEPRATAPGWQANNDLYFLPFKDGEPGQPVNILDTNSGGIYGWWGITFYWSPEGSMLAYSRPDSIGLVDMENQQLISFANITPYNTHGDWAWTPGMAWAGDSRSLFYIMHAAPTGLVSPEESPNFDLVNLALADNHIIPLIQQTGMFASPVVSPAIENEAGSTHLVAFLQAIFSTQSKTSRYLLDVMNSDGTDLHQLFPEKGQTGLEPHMPVWAPRQLATGEEFMGVLYEGNLWIVDSTTGESQQVTGDGLTSQIDWK